jgi:hypothetical protein
VRKPPSRMLHADYQYLNYDLASIAAAAKIRPAQR